MALIGDNNMEFDSFLIIDDNGHKTTVMFNTKRLSNKHKKNLNNNNFVIGEVGSGMNFELKQGMLRNILRGGHTIQTTYHANNSDSQMLIDKLKEDVLGYKKQLSKRQVIASKRALSYREKRHNNSIKRKTISKSTLKKLRKHLAVYGYYSIKLKHSYFEDDSIAIKAYDESVFDHLYLYNSKTKDCINVKDYIAINIMSGDGTVDWFYRGLIFTNDSFGEYELALKKGEFNQLHILKGLRI